MSTKPAAQEALPPLQKWICSRELTLPPTPDKLMTELRACLLKAKLARRLSSSQDEIIHKLLKKTDPVDHKLYARLELDPEEHPREQVFSIVGGQKDYKDDACSLHFLRDDGARFNFCLTLHLHPNDGMVLLAYDFELRLAGIDALSFVRFDLNPPANRRPDKMRCHLHLNQDDDGLSVPAPLLHPVELLDLFINGLRQGKVRHH